MLTSLSEMRARARQSLQGHWGAVALITLINSVISVTISGITSATTFLSFLSVFTAVFSATYSVSLYRTHRKSDDYDDLFNVYFDLGDKKWLRYLGYQMAYVIPLIIGLCVIVVLYLVAGSLADLIDLGTLTSTKSLVAMQTQFLEITWPVWLLCIAAAIYVSLAMALVPYIIFDHPELGCAEVLRRSWFMMKGHKWQLLLLQLSFIGWILLAILTLFIAMFWITPYIETAKAEFYLQVKAEHGELGDRIVYEEDIETVEAEEVN